VTAHFELLMKTIGGALATFRCTLPTLSAPEPILAAHLSNPLPNFDGHRGLETTNSPGPEQPKTVAVPARTLPARPKSRRIASRSELLITKPKGADRLTRVSVVSASSGLPETACALPRMAAIHGEHWQNVRSKQRVFIWPSWIAIAMNHIRIGTDCTVRVRIRSQGRFLHKPHEIWRFKMRDWLFERGELVAMVVLQKRPCGLPNGRQSPGIG
jgi:hypothetical protein